MATKKKKKPAKKAKARPLRSFADKLTGRGSYKGANVPRGATRATDTRGRKGYIDPKTQKFVPLIQTKPKAKKKK